MNKYRAKKTTCSNGHIHSSKRESLRCDELHLLERSGVICLLRVEPQFFFVIDGKQVKFPNGRRAGYRPDFSYAEIPGLNNVVEDVKSGPTMTEAAALRMAIFRSLFPEFELRIVK